MAILNRDELKEEDSCLLFEMKTCIKIFSRFLGVSDNSQDSGVQA